jgi:hypothetical protein
MTPDNPESKPGEPADNEDEFERMMRESEGEVVPEPVVEPATLATPGPAKPPTARTEPALSDMEPARPIDEHEKARNQRMVSERLEERLEKPERTDDRVSHAPATNLQRGFLRLTLVVSVLAGILVGLADSATEGT